MADDPEKKRPAPPRAAPRDATDVVPGGVPQSLTDDLRTMSNATDPFRKGSVAEFRETMGEDPGRPASGRIPPHPVPVGDVAAARGMLSPAGGMASVRKFLVTKHPDGTESQEEVDPFTHNPITPDDAEGPGDEEANRQAAAMHAETEKRNADIRSRRPRAPGERY